MFFGLKFEKPAILFLSCLFGVSVAIAFIRFVTINRLLQNAILIYLFINIILMILMGMREGEGL